MTLLWHSTKNWLWGPQGPQDEVCCLFPHRHIYLGERQETHLMAGKAYQSRCWDVLDGACIAVQDHVIRKPIDFFDAIFVRVSVPDVRCPQVLALDPLKVK